MVILRFLTSSTVIKSYYQSNTIAIIHSKCYDSFSGHEYLRRIYMKLQGRGAYIWVIKNYLTQNSNQLIYFCN